jgi:nucleoside-diphosphate-sugar epimerase
MSNPLSHDLNHILAQTTDIWEEFRSQRIFITGGTGFFGCWLLESFIWANDNLGLNSSACVLSRDPDNFKKKVPHLASHPSIQLYKGDVRSFEFPEGEFSYIIHAATDASAFTHQSDPLLVIDTTVEGTRRVLNFAKSCGAKKLLLTSSGAVYGQQPSEITHISEDYCGSPDLTNPRSAYGESKRLSELLCVLYAHQYGFEVKIARCFAFVGPYLPLDDSFAIGNFIKDVINRTSIKIQNDGTSYRSYLYAADLVIWLWTILFNGESCYPYNVGSESDITIEQAALAVAATSEEILAVEIGKPPSPGQFSQRYVPNTQRAFIGLGLAPTIELSTAIQRTIRWQIKDVADFKIID